jgi:thioredoxin-related protein
MGLLIAVPGAVGAAPGQDPGAGKAMPTGIELIAFEAPGCIYCPVLRRDVLPSYSATRAGKTAPLRFVDLNDAAADSFQLSGPVTMVPTLVLVRDGVEIGRISGYFGRENVHHMLDAMLPSE